jgi:hypothetical protein
MRNLIPGLARRLLRLLGRDERGVIGVLVAVLMGSGVLVGLGALVIDTGQLYQERAELQNGAEAGALAVAKSCATGTCTSSLAAQYANENASALTGNSAAVVGVPCGSVAPLVACGASTGLMTDCPGAPSGAGAGYVGYVDVHTSTKLAGGSTLLPPVFAKTLLGNGSYTGSTVKACAQAAWGAAPSNTLSTAFTISACEWDKATTTGTVYAQAPPYPPNTAPASTLDQVIKLRSGTGTGCTHYAAPADAVNLFGWVTETGGCTLQIAGTTYSVLTTTSSPNCNTPLFDDAQNRTLIEVPVYTSVTGCCGSAVYNLKGIAAFVVTGYNIPGSTFNFYSDWLNSANNCSGVTYCINGYFVRTVLPVSGTFGTAATANLGLSMVKLTG